MSKSLERDKADDSVRDHLESLAQAIRDKDIDALMTHYAPDIVVYDVHAAARGSERSRLSKELRAVVCVDAGADRL